MMKKEFKSFESGLVSAEKGRSGRRLVRTVLFLACLAAFLAFILLSTSEENRARKIARENAERQKRYLRFTADLNALLEQFEREARVPVRADVEYKIERGLSLNKLARRLKAKHGLAESLKEIVQGIVIRNNIEDPTRIRAGDTLVLPLSQFIRPHVAPPMDARMLDAISGGDILNRYVGHGRNDERDSFQEKTFFYTVARGDTLYMIAQRIKELEGLDVPIKWFVQEIAARNDIDDPMNVYPGTELEIVATTARTLAGLLNYDGFRKRKPILPRLNYSVEEIESFMDLALKKYRNIPEKTFARMLRVESGGDIMAISPVGAAGLMQIMPLTGQKLGLKIWNGKGYQFPTDIAQPGAKALYRRYAQDLQSLAQKDPRKLIALDDRFNPQKNILASARLFSRLVTLHGTRNAVAIYNGGLRGLTANRAQETKNYMRMVLR